MRFDGQRVALVDEWYELDSGHELWFRLFGCVSQAVRVADNLSRDRRPNFDRQARAIAEALEDPNQLAIEDFAADFQIVQAIPDAKDSLDLEIWINETPFTGNRLEGRR